MVVKRDSVNRAYREGCRVVLPTSAIQGIDKKRAGDTITLVDVVEHDIFPGVVKDAMEYGKAGNPETNVKACGDVVFDPMAPGDNFLVFDAMR